MALTFPLVSPIPISTSGAYAGSAVVCLVPGSTPTFKSDTTIITIALTFSNPTQFSVSTSNPLLKITFTEGVCTITGPPAHVLTTMLEGIRFTYDLQSDVSKEKIAAVVHDGSASISQLLTFAQHLSPIGASIAAAGHTSFNMNVASPFPTISLDDHVGQGKSLAAVTIIPETPSAVHTIGASSTFGATVHVNATNTAGRATTETLTVAQNTPVTITDRNIVSVCFKGTVSQLSQALAKVYFIAPAAVSGNTTLRFNIVISDDTYTIMSQQITLHGVQMDDTHSESTKEGSLPIYGTMRTSVLPPAPVNGVPYTVQSVKGTLTWVPTIKAFSLASPVNVVAPNAPTTAVVAPLPSTVSSDIVTTTNTQKSNDSNSSVFAHLMSILIIIVCVGLFGGLSWLMYKEWDKMLSTLAPT